ncbi:MAG TPA: IclR family transcriptional regulator [Xanthobacteraceae bacterium]|nr:IclR family transcriptional regulator [Xanthobacteraceae bacterium]
MDARTSQSSSQQPRRSPGTGTLDLALRILEHLAHRSRNASLGEIAREFSASKATVYRHLQALVQQRFVHQDPVTGNYEIGIKLVVLGEAARGRFDIVRAARDELIALRDRTQQAATICGMVQESLVVLDLIQGHTVIEFGTRPGTRLALDASAHGKVWLAFSSGAPIEQTLTQSRACKSPIFIQEIAKVRRRGWATAASEVIEGVNALAAPVFDHSARMIGSIAIVGATQYIPPEPARAQIEAVVGAAQRISRALGWRQHERLTS